jgi:hypothetical protein
MKVGLSVKPNQITKKGKAYRKSVCAEVYGKYNPMQAVETEYHLKTDEEKDNLTAILKQKFMFKNLNEEDFEIILDSFKKNTFKAGDMVIK